MAETGKKWFVIRAISGKEKKVKVKLFPWEDLNALGVVKKAFKL